MRFALSIPPFTDPAVVVGWARSAEAHGWDGFFLWDHLRWDDQVEVHDPWVLLGAIATATERLRIGTMVTPLSRRRPAVVAKHLVTLDHLSGGPGDARRRSRRPAGLRLRRLRRRAVVRRASGHHRRGARRAVRAARRLGLPSRRASPGRGDDATGHGAATHPDLDRRPRAQRQAARAGPALGRLRADRVAVPDPGRARGVRRGAPARRLGPRRPMARRHLPRRLCRRRRDLAGAVDLAARGRVGAKRSRAWSRRRRPSSTRLRRRTSSGSRRRRHRRPSARCGRRRDGTP